MKKVKLVCPTNAPIEVDEEHAKRMMAMPQNKIAKWEIADNHEKKEDAATVDNNRNKGASKEEPKQGATRKGSKP